MSTYLPAYDQLNGYASTAYFKDFKNQIIRVTHLWKPVGLYEFEEPKLENSNASIPEAKAKLVEKQGLEITVKGSNNSYFRLRVACTDELWDNIMSNKIWQYRDDIIYLKFDNEGVAYEYVLKANTQIPVGEYSDEDYKPAVPRVQTLIDARNKGSADIPSSNYMGSLAIFKVNEDNTVQLFSKSTVDPKVIEQTRLMLEAKSKSAEGVNKFDVLDNEKIVSDVRNDGKFIYVDLA